MGRVFPSIINCRQTCTILCHRVSSMTGQNFHHLHVPHRGRTMQWQLRICLPHVHHTGLLLDQVLCEQGVACHSCMMNWALPRRRRYACNISIMCNQELYQSEVAVVHDAVHQTWLASEPDEKDVAVSFNNLSNVMKSFSKEEDQPARLIRHLRKCNQIAVLQQRFMYYRQALIVLPTVLPAVPCFTTTSPKGASFQGVVLLPQKKHSRKASRIRACVCVYIQLLCTTAVLSMIAPDSPIVWVVGPPVRPRAFFEV
mmetsp:Transcript_46033/g.127864  ORF Transcript_46033/g.127864 Transcript_46033/m.127864 type:complete len:256 (-) Transcript_46033:438-1205(-)